jgi:hypothetical protein
MGPLHCHESRQAFSARRRKHRRAKTSVATGIRAHIAKDETAKKMPIKQLTF